MERNNLFTLSLSQSHSNTCKGRGRRADTVIYRESHDQTTHRHTSPQPIRPTDARGLGLVRVSKGCHRKFRGHNFESCVTNFDKISFFSLRSRYGKFRGFHPSNYKIFRSVSDLQNPTATPLTQAGAAHRGTRLSAPHTITMLLFYQTITVL